jgi:hypothetical protein
MFEAMQKDLIEATMKLICIVVTVALGVALTSVLVGIWRSRT